MIKERKQLINACKVTTQKSIIKNTLRLMGNKRRNKKVIKNVIRMQKLQQILTDDTLKVKDFNFRLK